MTMHKAMHPRDDVDRLYVSRKKGGRGLASIEDSVDAWIRLKDSIEKLEGGLLTATRNDIDKTKTTRNDIDKTKTNGMTITRKQKWEEKQLYACLND